MLIFGIQFGHDSSITVVRDGEIIASVEEERFTRIKVYKGFPYGGMEYIENEFKLYLKDADYIVISGEKIFENYSSQTFYERLMPSEKRGNKYLGIFKKIVEDKSLSREKNEKLFYDFMKGLGVSKDKIQIISHHLSHAASTYFQAPFKDTLVVTSDGKGDDVSSEVYHCQNGDFEKLTSISALSSLGQMYSAITQFLGFRPNRHEGKITGLAAYGDPEKLGSQLLEFFKFNEVNGNYSSIFEKEIYESSDDGLNACSQKDKLSIKSLMPYRIDRQYTAISCMYQNKFKQLWLNESKEDVAAAAQYVLETITVQYISHWVKKTGLKYVCLAGGVFANVKLNQRVLNIPEVENIFVQPAMGDSGLGLGGALYQTAQVDNTFKGTPIHDVYKGPEFSNGQILEKLKQTDFKYEKLPLDELASKIAELLTKSKIAGLFTGRMEYGPRALGARSIVISPFDKSINDSVNARLNRTEFMPFAPVILDKFAHEYFVDYKEDHIAAEFMTVTYDVFPDKIDKIEAVVHVDGTARPQVIKKEKNLLYYMIIEKFYELTGVPVLVNTSFNAHEEPILQNIDNAINALNNDIVDYLVIGNYLVHK